MEQWTFEHIKWLLSLGVGGILAGAMFGFYRKDMTAWRREKDESLEQSKQDREVLLSALANNTEAMTRIVGSLEANTKSLDANTRAVDHLQQQCGLMIGLHGAGGQ